MSFRERAVDLNEFMDLPDCEEDLLSNTYQQFTTINHMFARWRKTYTKFIKPRMQRTKVNTILDIGSGGGDIAQSIYNWATSDGYDVHVTGIDSNERTINLINRQTWPDNMEFIHGSIHDLASGDARYDFIISNHLIHHLNADEISDFFRLCTQLVNGTIIFSDIERSPIAYFAFDWITRPWFKRSYVVADGLISIRRSYTRGEMAGILPEQWKLHTIFPYRLILEFNKRS